MTDPAFARFHWPRIFGIEIQVGLGWLVIALWIGWSLASGALPQVYKGLPIASYWIMAAVVVLGLGVSIILHEIAHSLVARAHGMKVDNIRLFLLGGVSELKDEPASPRSELLMAIAGPALSLVLGVVLGLIAGAMEASGASKTVTGSIGYLAAINIILAVFNLIPAFPMDGGRVLRALIWMGVGERDRATRIAARIGQGFSVLLIVAGFVLALFGDVAAGLWWIPIGFFLRMASGGYLSETRAREVLEGWRAGALVEAAPQTFPAGMSVTDFLAGGHFTDQHGLFPVVNETGAILGVVEAAGLLKIPREAWPHTSLAQACTLPETAPIAQAGEPAAELLERMRSGGHNRVLVVDHGRAAGLVTVWDLMERLELEGRLNQALRGA